MSSMDDERDHDVAGDLLSPWGARSGSSDGACDDGEVDLTGSGGSERTTGVGGANIIIKGNGESNGNLGDGLRERDGNARD